MMTIYAVTGWNTLDWALVYFDFFSTLEKAQAFLNDIEKDESDKYDFYEDFEIEEISVK